MQKSKEISSYSILEFDVYYINDERLKDKYWLETLHIPTDEYRFAPGYLDGDGESFTKECVYYININGYKDDIDLSTLTFEEFGRRTLFTLYKLNTY